MLIFRRRILLDDFHGQAESGSTMKSRLMLAAVLSFLICHAAPVRAADTNAPVNYIIKVTMKDSKGNFDSLQVTTTPGSFELDTVAKTVKVNTLQVPSTLKMNGTLTAINDEKANLTLFLGRTVPYVTGTGSNGTSSSYSQLSVGLQSNFVATFGKPLLIQADDSGEVTVLVTRQE